MAIGSYGVKLYKDGKKFLFLGEPYSMKIVHATSISLVGSSLHFPKALLFRARKEMEIWYRKQALAYITKRVEWYAKRMKVEYAGVSVADTKSRWGACDPHNRLQFNWRLIMTPHAVLDSVIVHELAHTVEKNHSRNFWILVRRVMAGYTAYRQWLNHNGQKLIV